MTGLLASVRSVAEAEIAITADIVDVKEPSAGALGRVDPAILAAIVAKIARRRPVSATIGDVPLEPAPVLAATRETLRSGVDYAKIGMFEGDRAATFAALTPLARAGARLIAVIFADRPIDEALVEACRAAGFAGVMLDTADKRAGPLTRHLDLGRLASFVGAARSANLLCGLAGSLTLEDVEPLATLSPDYLGFRSALCARARTGDLDPERLQAARAALDAANSATAAAGAARAAVSAKSPTAPNSAPIST